jgi:proline iminopeptidase
MLVTLVSSMLRHEEIRWFYQEGASFLFPDAWEVYLSPIPVEERGKHHASYPVNVISNKVEVSGDLVTAYHKRLNSPDPEVRRAAAKAWY